LRGSDILVGVYVFLVAGCSGSLSSLVGDPLFTGDSSFLSLVGVLNVSVSVFVVGIVVLGDLFGVAVVLVEIVAGVIVGSLCGVLVREVGFVSILGVLVVFVLLSVYDKVGLDVGVGVDVDVVGVWISVLCASEFLSCDFRIDRLFGLYVRVVEKEGSGLVQSGGTEDGCPLVESSSAASSDG